MRHIANLDWIVVVEKGVRLLPKVLSKQWAHLQDAVKAIERKAGVGDRASGRGRAKEQTRQGCQSNARKLWLGSGEGREEEERPVYCSWGKAEDHEPAFGNK